MQKKEKDYRKILNFFSLKRIIIPIIIGVGITLFLIINDFSKPKYIKTELGQGNYTWVDLNNDESQDADEFILAQDPSTADYLKVTQKEIFRNVIQNWHWYSFLFLFIAIICVVLRDLGYMLRLRLLTDKQLSWKRCFQVIMLWEFSSALTPSVVGGSAVALFIVTKEGIPAGRSTSIVLITALFDELFYITIVPIVLLIAGFDNLFPANFSTQLFGYTFGVKQLFFIGYSFMVLLTFIILFAIFIKPRSFKYILLNICKLKFLRRWRTGAAKMGDDVIITSREMKQRSWIFWMKIYFTTLLSWTSRFWVVNFLILAISPVGNHFMIYARQLVMWVILLISPTPGGSGIAEYTFPIFLGDFIPVGMSPTLAIIWRFLTYYPYIIIGIIVLPLWLRRVIRYDIRKAMNKEKEQISK